MTYREKYEKWLTFDEETAKETINKYIETMNESLVSYKQIHSVEFTDKEFEKTTTLKIKR